MASQLRFLLFPLALMVTITLVSGTNNLAQPPGFSLIAKDKLIHFLVFGLVATAIIRLPLFKDRQRLGFWIAVIGTCLFGAADEFHQSFTPGRMVEFDDWLADSAGALVAAILWQRWRWYRNVCEFHVTALTKRRQLRTL